MKDKLKVIQFLPELNSGGVERGTIEFSAWLVERGHDSTVVSAGGRQEGKLADHGGKHVTLPVHKKSISSLFQVKPVRKLLEDLAPDVIHVRSRVPAWIVWLAWRKMDPATRPKLVSTFHGMYSVSFYSAIMAKAERIIAISDCVQNYILKNYSVSKSLITKIYRGLDQNEFNTNPVPSEWEASFYSQYPQLKDKKLILMPGRLTRWKGQEHFIKMMAKVVAEEPSCVGLLAGEADPNKEHFKQELVDMAKDLGISANIVFLGHRSDVKELYKVSDITCHMSTKEEPFGRTVPEALASGCKVIAYDRGGASESLGAAYPAGLTKPDDIEAFAEKLLSSLDQAVEIHLPKDFYLSTQAEKTFAVYLDALGL